LTDLTVAPWRDLLGKSASELPSHLSSPYYPFLFEMAFARSDSFTRGMTADQLSLQRTNIQTLGIDEADVMEITADGLLFVHGGQVLSIIDVRDPAHLVLRASIDLPEAGVRLFVSGNRLITISQDFHSAWQPQDFRIASDMPWSSLSAVLPRSNLRVYDLSDPSHPALVNQVTMDGRIVDAWLHEDRLVVTKQSRQEVLRPRFLAENPEASFPRGRAPLGRFETEQEFRDRIRPISLEEWTESIRIASSESASPRQILLADWDSLVFSSSESMNYSYDVGLTTVALLQIGNDGLALVDSEVIHGEGIPVAYFAGQNLYLAFDLINGSTRIDQISVSDDVDLQATGEIRGQIRDARMMNEHSGTLRVFSERRMWDPASQDGNWTDLTILQANEGGELSRLGGLGDIAEGQVLYSAFFDGDQAFATTWINNPWGELAAIFNDPLHSFDLSDPRAPVELHELVIPGASTYLHAVGNQHLLGLGYLLRDGAYHLQVSLYDASDLSHLSVIDTWVSSESVNASFAALNAHAIQYDVATGILLLDADEAGLAWQQVPLRGIRVDWDTESLVDLGEIDQFDVRRSIIVDDTLITVGTDQVKTYSIHVNSQQAFECLDNFFLGPSSTTPPIDPAVDPIPIPSDVLPIESMRSVEYMDDARKDVNYDGLVSAMDALVILNRLNDVAAGTTDGEGRLTHSELLPRMDVSGDGMVTALDALQVINRLNEFGSTEVGQLVSMNSVGNTGEGESGADPVALDHDLAIQLLAMEMEMGGTRRRLR
jgi:hypothetical protein